MRQFLIRSCAALALSTMAPPAFAAPVTATNPQSVAKVLQDAGYRAEMSKDDSGDPMIKSTSSGTNFLVLFYGCKNNANCATVQFFAGYTDPKNGSLAALNEWNAKNRFGRAYLTDSGSARLEMDVDLDDGGMSALLFQDNLEFWVAIMASFEKHINGA